jgi:hypothetical protein
VKNSRKATIAALATACLALVTVSSWAAGPYTVSVDGDSSGAKYAYTTTQKVTTTLVVHNGANNRTISCSTVGLHGTVNTGVGLSGVDVLDVSSTSSDWAGCSYLATPPVTISPSSAGWQFNATGPSTVGTTDTVTGTITSSSGTTLASVSMLGGLCTFAVAGSAGASFVESKTAPAVGQDLVVNEVATSATVGNLKVVAPVSSGCLGTVAAGNTVDFTGQWNINVTAHSGTPINIAGP